MIDKCENATSNELDDMRMMDFVSQANQLIWSRKQLNSYIVTTSQCMRSGLDGTTT